MGFFSGDTELFVDSVVYNLAGPEVDRPNYLKSLVIGNALSSNKAPITQTLQNGYLYGPAMKFRSFYRWASKPINYDQVGMPTGSLSSTAAVNAAALEDYLTSLTGKIAWVERAVTGQAEYGLWVEQWLLDNNPAAMNTAYKADINDAGNLIRITYVDATSVTFVPAGFDKSAQYIFAWYNLVDPENAEPQTTGSVVQLGTAAFPSTAGWTLISTSVVGGTTEWVYTRTTVQSTDADGVHYLRETQHNFEEATPLNRYYRIDTQTYVGVHHRPLKMLIYKLGSGNATLDALITPGDSLGQFFPFIPVRLDNVFISETSAPTVYAQTKKAYKKATGSDIEDLITKLETNPDLGDIDYVFIQFGVSLNVVEDSCKQYLYKFFERLQASQAGGPSIYELWKAAMIDAEGESTTWGAWKNAQSIETDPLYGTPEPTRPNVPDIAGNMIQITGTTPVNYDIRLRWLYITNGSGLGLGKPGAKKGDLWFETLPPDEFNISAYSSPTATYNTLGSVDRIRLYWQTTTSTFSYLEIVGMSHANYVYGGKAVNISASQALADLDESGFIVPLHYDTWREVSLVHTSQMATACVFVVMNCYKEVSTPWYATGLFKILIVIVIAVVSVTLTGGTGLGLLGAHMAVGAALGLTGLTAAIVGSIANALAAMILVTIIQEVAVDAFGPQIGFIIAAIAMIIVGSAASSFQSAGSIAVNWGDMLSIDNLMKLTSAVGSAVEASITQDITDLTKQMKDLETNAQKESEKIQQAYFNEFGYGAGQIDPMMLVDSSSTSGILAESSNSFLSRTLMTGSDLAELSQDLLYNFPEYSTKLPDAFT